MRAMRLIVMFDLPVATKAEKKAYAEFRRFLVKDGYIMEQFSVYSRVTLGRDSMSSHINRLKENLPATGSVTLFSMTEKQFEGRMRLVRQENDSCHEDYGAQMTLII